MLQVSLSAYASEADPASPTSRVGGHPVSTLGELTGFLARGPRAFVAGGQPGVYIMVHH